jgi:hypothetical protein
VRETDEEFSITIKDIKKMADHKYENEYPEQWEKEKQDTIEKTAKKLPHKEHQEGQLERFLEMHPNATQVEQALLFKLPEVNKVMLKSFAKASDISTELN